MQKLHRIKYFKNSAKSENTINYCTIGYNDFDFFKKIKSPDPLIDAKLNSKTHF